MNGIAQVVTFWGGLCHSASFPESSLRLCCLAEMGVQLWWGYQSPTVSLGQGMEVSSLGSPPDTTLGRGTETPSVLLDAEWKTSFLLGHAKTIQWGTKGLDCLCLHGRWPGWGGWGEGEEGWNVCVY